MGLLQVITLMKLQVKQLRLYHIALIIMVRLSIHLFGLIFTIIYGVKVVTLYSRLQQKILAD